jgi:NAD(P) transhydrogenase
MLSMGPKGRFFIDYDDEAVRGALVMDQGKITWPAPAAAPKPATDSKPVENKPVPVPVSPERLNFNAALSGSTQLTLIFAAIVALGMGGTGLAATVTAFSLACIAGAQVVYGVSPALHSPLMSVTNAISGITAVGGLVCMGGGITPQTPAQKLASLAVMVSCVNIAGCVHK